MIRMRAALLVLTLTGTAVLAQPDVPPVEMFLAAGGLDERQSRAALDDIAPLWRDDYAALIIDLARLLRPSAAAPDDTSTAEFAGGGEPGDDSGGGRLRRDDMSGPVRRRPMPEGLTRARLIQFLERRTGKQFDPQLREWRRWVWSRPYAPHPDYARFKSLL
jgi:hypothetical protein